MSAEAEGLARKARSEEALRARGVLIHDWLPWIAPNGVRSLDEIVARVSTLGLVAVHAEFRLRTANEVLDARDLAFRLHWAVRNARIHGTAYPDGVDDGVVLERHYALNWLTRDTDCGWDDIDTST